LASEWNAPSIVTRLEQLQAERANKIAERDELSRETAVVQRAQLLDPECGTLILAFQEADQHAKQLNQRLVLYQAESFQWLYEKGYLQRSVEPNGFTKMWRMITLTTRKRNKHLATLEETFPAVDKYTLADQYDMLVKEQKAQDEKVKGIYAEWQAAAGIVERYDALGQWEDHFDEVVVNEVTTTMDAHLAQQPLDGLIRQVGENQRTHVGAMHALAKKIEYSHQLIGYLENEINDRRDRVRSIDRVRRKWRRNPSGSVRGDKSKWLQQLPANKQVGTQKRIGWSRSMRSNMHSYNRYDDYSGVYFYSVFHDQPFLAFDMFNHRPEYRMPYEGFSSSVIPEITDFRDEVEVEDGKWFDDYAEEAEESVEGFAEGFAEEAVDDTAEMAAAALAVDAVADAVDGAYDFADAS